MAPADTDLARQLADIPPSVAASRCDITCQIYLTHVREAIGYFTAARAPPPENPDRIYLLINAKSR